jgi:hypothetical protein
MVGLLIGIEGSAARSHFIFLRSAPFVNPNNLLQRQTAHYRVSGLVHKETVAVKIYRAAQD